MQSIFKPRPDDLPPMLAEAGPTRAGCVVFNPSAGSADEVENLKELVALAPSITFCETGHEGHATQLAREGVERGDTWVIAAGGDGTVREVATGLAEAVMARADTASAAPSLLIVPLGTGNDLARTLELPDDPAAALNLVQYGRIRPLDLYRWRRGDAQEGWEGWGINVAAGGFSAKLADVLTPEMKHRWGPLAYTRAAVASMDELRPYRVTLHIDDAPPKRMTALNVIIANARFAGGGIQVAPEADCSDGLLDIVVVHPGGMLDLTGLAARFVTGSALESELVDHSRGRRVTVHSEPAMHFNVDGDPVGEGTFTFECVPAAVQVLCPAEE